MFNIITKFYNMLGEIIGYGNIKKKKCNKMHGGYTANDEKSDDFDNISSKGDGGIGGEGSGGKGGCSGYDDNTVMVDGLELILLKVLKL